MASVPTVGYWDIRGLCEPIRYLLKYAKVDFIDKRYQFNNVEEWKKDKTSLGLDFPNLPYYLDGRLKMTQSLSILRYLGRKHGLATGDYLSIAKLDMIGQQFQDMKTKFMILIMDEGFEAKKAEYINNSLKPQLELIVKYLGDNEWLAGAIIYMDFLLYDILDWFRRFTPETIDQFPTLKDYLNRFENLPAIKAYQSSPEHKSWPLFGPVVKWGAK